MAHPEFQMFPIRLHARQLIQYYVGLRLGDQVDTGDVRFDHIIEGYSPGFGTTCGFLCHWLLWRLGCSDRDIVNRNEPGIDPQNPVFTYQNGQNISRIHHGGKPPFNTIHGTSKMQNGARPLAGDIVFIKHEPNGEASTEHVFVFLDEFVMNGKTFWRTAEAGQKNRARRECARIKERQLILGSVKGAQLTGEKSGEPTRAIKGWLPLAELNYFSFPPIPPIPPPPLDPIYAKYMTKLVGVSVLPYNENYIYFFQLGNYVRYDVTADKVDAGYPKPIAGNWPGLFTSNIDAAVIWPTGKAYFFSGNQYTRYDVAADKADVGYPKPIAGNWPGLFTSNIDAIAIWPDNKAYFFKGSQYMRYDIKTDKIDQGYPKPIAGNWPGLFPNRVDGVIVSGDGKAYFFQGNQYVRYDIAADCADPGYPKPIVGNWHGLEVFANTKIT